MDFCRPAIFSQFPAAAAAGRWANEQSVAVRGVEPAGSARNAGGERGQRGCSAACRRSAWPGTPGACGRGHPTTPRRPSRWHRPRRRRGSRAKVASARWLAERVLRGIDSEGEPVRNLLDWLAQANLSLGEVVSELLRDRPPRSTSPPSHQPRARRRRSPSSPARGRRAREKGRLLTCPGVRPASYAAPRPGASSGEASMRRTVARRKGRIARPERPARGLAREAGLHRGAVVSRNRALLPVQGGAQFSQKRRMNVVLHPMTRCRPAPCHDATGTIRTGLGSSALRTDV
jgi:hypothetical protein